MGWHLARFLRWKGVKRLMTLCLLSRAVGLNSSQPFSEVKRGLTRSKGWRKDNPQLKAEPLHTHASATKCKIVATLCFTQATQCFSHPTWCRATASRLISIARELTRTARPLTREEGRQLRQLAVSSYKTKLKIFNNWNRRRVISLSLKSREFQVARLMNKINLMNSSSQSIWRRSRLQRAIRRLKSHSRRENQLLDLTRCTLSTSIPCTCLSFMENSDFLWCRLRIISKWWTNTIQCRHPSCTHLTALSLSNIRKSRLSQRNRRTLQQTQDIPTNSLNFLPLQGWTLEMKSILSILTTVGRDLFLTWLPATKDLKNSWGRTALQTDHLNSVSRLIQEAKGFKWWRDPRLRTSSAASTHRIIVQSSSASAST